MTASDLAMTQDAIVQAGAPVGDPIRVLRELAMHARNVVAVGRDIEMVRDDYLRWVEDAEVQLRSRFASDGVWRALHSDRYWHIRDLQRSSPRPFPVIDHEARLQADRLEGLGAQLELGQQQFQVPEARTPVVPDTNVLCSTAGLTRSTGRCWSVQRAFALSCRCSFSTNWTIFPTAPVTSESARVASSGSCRNFVVEVGRKCRWRYVVPSR